jgi:hypothetical protein
MSNDGMMSFETFRALWNSPGNDQQREALREDADAEAILEPSVLRILGWVPWDGAQVTA